MFEMKSPLELTDNFFSCIGKDWMLVTAGDREHLNTMTAAWGGIGVLWNKNVATIFVRPQRYTFEFLEKYPKFTLSFFDEKYRKQLALCGAKSGRDIDKVKECGFTAADETVPYFNEARLVLVCRKLYTQDLNPEHFLDPALSEFYEAKDYHRMYIAEIETALVKQKNS
ncbi:MAG: flavin reductase family protein [Evtepia sp.]